MLNAARKLASRAVSTSGRPTLLSHAIGAERLLSVAALRETIHQQTAGDWRSDEDCWSVWSRSQCRGFSASGALSVGGPDPVPAGQTQESSVEGTNPDWISASSDNNFATNSEGTSDTLLSADAITYAVSSAEELSLAAAWDEAWFINKGFQYAIQALHSSTGLAWWQSIALSTAFARMLTLPLTVKQVQNTYRMAKARPELEKLAEWFKEQQAAGRGPEAQQEYMTRMAATWAKYDCNPFKSMLPLVAQLPIFIGFFQALRTMSAAKANCNAVMYAEDQSAEYLAASFSLVIPEAACPSHPDQGHFNEVPSLTVGGPSMLWLGDLTIADPYYALPIASSLLLLLTIELNAADGLQGQDPVVLNRTKMFMRVFSVLMIFATSSMPQGVFYYWIPSSILALGQSFVLKIGSVRKMLKLPPLGVTRAGAGPEVAGITAAATGKPVQTFSSPPRKRQRKQRGQQ